MGSVQHSLRCFLAILLLGTFSACTSVSKEDLTVGETPKELDVEWSRKTHLVGFEPRMAALGAEAKTELAAFLERERKGPDDRILVNPGKSVDGRNGLFAARGRAVQNFLADLGYISEMLPSHAGVANTAIVAVERYDVTLPDCPDWRALPALTNGVWSNYGCTTAVNLGRMVADPRDLVTGRDLGPMDGTVAASAVERYRKGEVKELEEEATADDDSSD